MKTIYVRVDTPETIAINEGIQLYKEGKKKACLDKFRPLFDLGLVDAFYQYANLIKEENATIAFEYATQGLEVDGNDFHLLKIKAELLTNYPASNLTATVFLNNLNLAFDFIKSAQKNFDVIFQHYKDSIQKNEIENSGTAVDLYYSQKLELNALEANITSTRSSVNVLIRVQQTEQLVIDTERRLFKERTRLMEVLGLFIAIFAFIFTSSQIALQYVFIEALVLISALGLVLMTFMLALHLAINPEERMRKLYYLFAIFIFILVALPLVPYLYTTIKYWLNLS